VAPPAEPFNTKTRVKPLAVPTHNAIPVAVVRIAIVPNFVRRINVV